jgi:hypothetical protein
MWARRTLTPVVATVLLGTLAVGCGDGDEATTTTTEPPATFPTAVVQDWLDAVASGDLIGIAAAVEETSATILIAAENGYDTAELASLLDGGLTEGVASSYWSTFASSFRDFRGLSLDDLTVGDFRSLAVPEGEFAAVELIGPEGASYVLTRRDESGRWWIDMVATFGPALVRTLRRLLDDAVGAPEEPIVSAGFAAAVLPALAAAVALDGGDSLLRSELAAMQVLVAGQ